MVGIVQSLRSEASGGVALHGSPDNDKVGGRGGGEGGGRGAGGGYISGMLAFIAV